MKKLLLMIMLLFVSVITCFSSFTRKASALVIYDSFDDLNGKQFYITFDSDEDAGVFTADKEVIDRRNSYYDNSKHYGKLEIYNENDEVIGTVENLMFGLFGNNEYNLFYYSWNGNENKYCLTTYDNTGKMHQILDPSYCIWTVPEEAFYVDKTVDVLGHVVTDKMEYIYGDFYSIRHNLSENASYSNNIYFEKGYEQGKQIGFSNGYTNANRDNAIIKLDVKNENVKTNTLQIIGISLSAISLLLSGLYLYKKLSRKKRKK